MDTMKKCVKSAESNRKAVAGQREAFKKMFELAAECFDDGDFDGAMDYVAEMMQAIRKADACSERARVFEACAGELAGR